MLNRLRTSKSPRSRRSPLSLSALEQRLTPSTYIVMSAADNGDNGSPILGSLREGLNYVNIFGYTEILFSLPPGAVIAPVAALQPVTKTCTISAGTSPSVMLDGKFAGMTSGLVLAAPGCTVRGLAIGGFAGAGISIDSGGATIESCNIGSDPSGKAKIANGVGIQIKSAGNTIGGVAAGKGNTISGNKMFGVEIPIGSASSNKIVGNRIGTSSDGTMPLPNGSHGIQIVDASGTTIGGDDAADGASDGVNKSTNIVFFNSGSGIAVAGKSAGGTTIKGNLIGDNSEHGIKVINVPGIVIGGGTAKAGNTIGLNDFAGISISESGGGAPGAGATIRGNAIGVMEAGTTALPNGTNGIEILDADSNLIGGTTPAERNLVAANLGVGVSIKGAAAVGNVVSGNYVGAFADGKTAAGNKAYGIYIGDGASKNTIGGVAAGAGNVVAFNGELNKLKGHGIVVASGVENAIRRNSLFDNFGRGIDLGAANAPDAVTINTEGDADAGANGLQDYPVIISRGEGAVAHSTWQLNSLPGTTYILEFFANDTPDPSGFGEGKTYLGDATVTTDAKGNALYTPSFVGAPLISATATDPSGNTSEFSMIDTDADALADRWETHGIDVDESSDPAVFVPDLVLPGASDTHKDLFVEFDAMTGHAPGQATLNALVAAFAAAPDSLVHNPDVTNGITLHVTLAGADVTIPAAGLGTNYWAAFDAIKAANFGTKAQRDGGNFANIRTALSWTHRYCLFAESYDNGNSSGVAELPGNDFIVTLPSGSWGGLTDSDRAGTFMHEMGHTLNLRHGGFEDTNYKPNYVSVMNYAWQFPDAVRRTVALGLASYETSWTLDYSREKLPSLDEDHLNETTGLFGAPGKLVPFGEGTSQGAITEARVGPQTGAIDWDGSGSATGTDVGNDINFDGARSVLVGHDDWSVLRFYFIESPSFPEGKHEDEPNHTVTTVAPAKVQQVTINDGDPQRSRVLSIEIDFDNWVELPGLPETAFRLRRNSDGLDVGLKAAVVNTATSTAVTLTFDGALVESGSLEDGRYTLTIFSAMVGNIFGGLDGNADGTAGGDYVLACADAPDSPTNIFRLFGDANGDGYTDLTDFLALRLAIGSDSTAMNWNPAFDSNGDGNIDINDLIAFRQRLGQTP